MAIPPLNTFSPETVNLDPTTQTSLPVMAWMYNKTAAGVPGDAGPWMLAQGWDLSGVSYDTSTTPATPYYNFYKQGMYTSAILQSLVNVYTNQFNEGRYLNAARYNNIVNNWSSQINAIVLDLEAAAAASNVQIGFAMDNLDSVKATVDGLMETERVTALAEFTALSGQITSLQAKVTTLESGFTDYSASLDAAITGSQTDLASYQAESATSLAQLLADYNSLLTVIRGLEATYASDLSGHVALYNTQLNSLASDFTAHSTRATAFLNDLGATELARINEAYDAKRAEVEQTLLNQGFYSSAVLSDRRAIVERERNQAITELNDKLAREKLENDHKLYEQMANMRARTMDGLDKLHQTRIVMTQWKEQVESRLANGLAEARARIVAGIDKSFAAGRDVSTTTVTQRTQRLGVQGQQIQTRSATTELQSRIAQARVEVMNRLAAFTMETVMKRTQTAFEKNSQEMNLIKYQIDSQNGLIVGLFGFQERRFDNYPSMEVLSQLCMGLGDSASTSWVSP